MLDVHQAFILFSDLDLALQEKTVRVTDFYAEITLSKQLNSTLLQNASMSKPPCGCTIDGFKQHAAEMKLKIGYCHNIVADHRPLFKCSKCDLVAFENILKVHEYFDCDD